MLTVNDATVVFGDVTALDGIDLEVRDGEILAILGRSGCGKSTLMRVVAGLQPLDSGDVRYNGEDLRGLPTHRRDFGLMFQEHALFPHRNVAENVSFGLKMKHMAARDRRKRVHEMLDLVGLGGYGDRQVATLSGGEAQRVALARSLAPKPRLLMLDEPLGSLDRPRRDDLTEELRTLLRQVGVTVLHITHDHDEAFAIADRVAVMNAGRVARIGTPSEIWHDPRDEQVARFLGHSDIVTVRDAGEVPWGRVDLAAGRVVLRSDAFRRIDHAEATSPVRINTVTGIVTDVRFRGAVHELRLLSDPGQTELTIRDIRPAAPGDRLSYYIDPSATATLE